MLDGDNWVRCPETQTPPAEPLPKNQLMPKRIDWPALRAAFESGCGVDELCLRFGVARRTVMAKIKSESWGAAALAMERSPPGTQAPNRRRKRTILSRLFDLLEKAMSDLEKRPLTDNAADTARERDAKLLGSLAAIYLKLKEIEADERKQRTGREPRSDSRDADQLRSELAARLDGLGRATAK